MKLSVCFLIFMSYWIFSNCTKINETDIELKKYSNLAKAITAIINAVFSRDITTANVILPENSQSSLLDDFKNELSAETFASSKAIIRQGSSSMYLANGPLKMFTIFIVYGLHDIKDIFSKISPSSFKFNGFYLVVIIGGEIKDIRGIFELFWSRQIFNLDVIQETASKVVEIKTFIPFGFKSCNDMSPILINQFKDGKFIKTNKDFFPEKVKNLQNCPIRVAVFNNSEPSVFVNRKNGITQLKGSDINLVKALAQSLNFKINYTFIGFNAFFCESFNSSVPFKSTFNGQAEFSASYWLLKINCLKVFDATTSYTTEKIVWIIPPGREYTFFEKLIYPFDLPLWGMIMVCFVTGMFIIFIIGRRSKVIQNLVFGVNVGNPYLNLFIGFIGGSQPSLPKLNFARFLLMVLLIYCLVIRTLYQGSFFELLHANKHFNEVQSIDEMVENDFTFYAQSGIAGLFYGSEAVKNRFKKIIY